MVCGIIMGVVRKLEEEGREEVRIMRHRGDIARWGSHECSPVLASYE